MSTSDLTATLRKVAAAETFARQAGESMVICNSLHRAANELTFALSSSYTDRLISTSRILESLFAMRERGALELSEDLAQRVRMICMNAVTLIESLQEVVDSE